jgi:hypothetical protein
MADDSTPIGVSVEKINLSMFEDTSKILDCYRDKSDTSARLTANTYTYTYTVKSAEGVEGTKSLTGLSIGQLVMAICLQRASELEAEIIEMMQEMENTSTRLEELSDIESRVVEKLQSDNTAYYSFVTLNSPVIKEEDLTESERLENERLNAEVKQISDDYTVLKDEKILDDNQLYIAHSTPLTINGTTIEDSKVLLYDDFITKIEAKMDEKNSFSQEKMIELQSYTNKRDQSYDMISNILKSLNTVLIGNANNM